MFLSLWAPSRHSFSLINSRPRRPPSRSNRCYGSEPSKFISTVKKNKTQRAQSWGGHPWLIHILIARRSPAEYSKGKTGPHFVKRRAPKTAHSQQNPSSAPTPTREGGESSKTLILAATSTLRCYTSKLLLCGGLIATCELLSLRKGQLYF